MKKLSFYTLCRTHCGIEALLVSGYTDSVFHYYRGTEKWHAVHPETGLSVCTSNTRLSVASLANSSELLSKVKQALEMRGADMKHLFSEKVAIAEQNAMKKKSA